jgi:hypothetical protein
MQLQPQKLLEIIIAIAVQILLNITGFDTLADYCEFIFDPQRFAKFKIALPLNSFVQSTNNDHAETQSTYFDRYQIPVFFQQF